MADQRAVVFVLDLIDPQADGRIRVFRNLATARRAARRWTGTTDADVSGWQWVGVGRRENYDAFLYRVRVE